MHAHFRNNGFKNTFAHFEWELFLGERQERPLNFLRNPDGHRHVTQYRDILNDQTTASL